MPKYNYVAMDPKGKETKGTLEVASQNEAIGRVKEMGLFPTKIVEVDKAKEKAEKGQKKPAAKRRQKKRAGGINFNIKIPGLSGKVKSKVLTTFTRQLATLVDAGLPLLRGLRVLEKQEAIATLKSIIGELALSIEGGSTFSEGAGAASQSFQPPFREHGQGRRTGRRARSRAEPPVRVHGKGAEDQRQGHRRHVLSRGRAGRGHRHHGCPDDPGHSEIQGSVSTACWKGRNCPRSPGFVLGHQRPIVKDHIPA